MGFFGAAGRIAGREIKHLAGGYAIGMGWRYLKEGYLRATHRRCPACERGLLFKFTVEKDGELHRALGCNLCAHYEASDVDADVASQERLRAIVQRQRKAIGEAGLTERHRKHVLMSRFFYFGAAVLWCVATYHVVFRGVGWGFGNALALSVWMFTQGLRTSYRSWQLATNTFYQPGAFMVWLKSGQWLV